MSFSAFRSCLRPSIYSNFRATLPVTTFPTVSQNIAKRFLTQQARKQIQQAVDARPLVLFMKGNPEQPQCGFSRAVVQILDLYNIPPEKVQTYDVLQDQELRNGIKEFSEWPTIPQLYVKGEFVGGCDIVLNMHQSGELSALLEKHDLAVEEQSEATTTTSTS